MPMAEKPTYKELEDRIRSLNSFILNSPGMVYSARPDWTTEVITKSEDVSGYSIDEFNSGKINWMDIIHPEDKDWVVNKSPHFTNGKNTISIEYKIIAKDGSTRWVLDKKTARFSSDNIFLGVSGIVLNITERKQIEIKLRESEIKYKGVFDESIAAIYVFDTDKNFIDSNQAGLYLLGYSIDELLKMSIPDVDADPVVVLPAHNQLLCGDRIINYEHRLKCKDGKIITVLNNSRPIVDNKNDVIGMLSTLIDITERIKAQDALRKAHNNLEQRVQERTAELENINEKLKLEIIERKHAVEALRESEAKLVRSKKMESLGLLAGGVAHDLNNVLSGIVSYPELILLNLPEDSKLKKPIETIQESGHRAVAIVQDLLTVARGVATVKDPLNLNEIIQEYLNSPEFKNLEQLHPEVRLDIKLDKNLLNIKGSHVHIRKILMNLITNASEAFEDRGNIIITTENTYIDKPLKGYDNINIGEYLLGPHFLDQSSASSFFCKNELFLY